MMKKLLLSILLTLLPMFASASVNVDGIYYDLNTETREAKLSSCSNWDLETLTIPDKVTSEGVEYSVTSIRNSAFHGCDVLTSVIIPNSVTAIEGFAFSGCSSLASVNIPISVKTIGEYAFENCSSLASVNIPISVTYLGAGAFRGTAWYENQPEGEVYAGRFFYKYKGEMPKDTQVKIKEGTIGILDQAFRDCTGLVSITIPNSVTYIGWTVFYGCKELKSIKVESGNQRYDSRNDCNAIIETSSNTLIVGCNTTIIPNGVTSIEEHAFCGGIDLKSITIPSSVKSIGEAAFMDCSYLFHIIMDAEDPPVYGFHAFPTIASLTVPNGAKEAYRSAKGWSDFIRASENGKISQDGNQFKVDGICYKKVDSGTVSVIARRNDFGMFIGYFGDIVIPDQVHFDGVTYNVTSISDKAFSSCDEMTSVVIGNNVTSIGDAAFEWCRNLNSVTIPSSVISIGIYAFAECYDMQHFISEIEDPISITANVFKNSFNLKLIVPKGTKAKYQATEGWNSISMIYEDGDEGSVFEMDGIYYEREKDNTVSVTCSDTRYFGDVVIPAQVNHLGETYKVTSINSYAFRNCYYLKSVTIPFSVTSIGSRAFWNCKGLASVITEIENPFTINDNVFDYIPADAQLIVPKGTKTKYQATEGWKKFANIVEISGVEGDANNDGVMNDSDVNDVESFIMGKMPPVFVRSVADMNGDGEINVVDIVLMQNIINRE